MATDLLQIGKSGTIAARTALELTAQAAPDARFKLETVNGSVDLTLAGEIDAEFDVETFNGSIKNCFGPEAERTSDYAPGRSLKFVQGNGSARISIGV